MMFKSYKIIKPVISCCKMIGSILGNLRMSIRSKCDLSPAPILQITYCLILHS